MQNISSLTQTSAGNLVVKTGKYIKLTDSSTGTKYYLKITDGVLTLVEA